MIWLPFASTKANLDVLNDQHIFEIVYEGLQCLRNIYVGDLSWRDARMWGEHPAALLAYVSRAEREMVQRGHSAEPRVLSAHVALSRAGWPLAPVPPRWYGNPRFHLSQRSHLIRVDPEYYARRMPPTTPLELPLIWPNERGLS
jgi:hypothetical protein